MTSVLQVHREKCLTKSRPQLPPLSRSSFRCSAPCRSQVWRSLRLASLLLLWPQQRLFGLTSLSWSLLLTVQVNGERDIEPLGYSSPRECHIPGPVEIGFLVNASPDQQSQVLSRAPALFAELQEEMLKTSSQLRAVGLKTGFALFCDRRRDNYCLRGISPLRKRGRKGGSDWDELQKMSSDANACREPFQNDAKPGKQDALTAAAWSAKKFFGFSPPDVESVTRLLIMYTNHAPHTGSKEPSVNAPDGPDCSINSGYPDPAKVGKLLRDLRVFPAVHARFPKRGVIEMWNEVMHQRMGYTNYLKYGVKVDDPRLQIVTKSNTESLYKERAHRLLQLICHVNSPESVGVVGADVNGAKKKPGGPAKKQTGAQKGLEEEVDAPPKRRHRWKVVWGLTGASIGVTAIAAVVAYHFYAKKATIGYSDAQYNEDGDGRPPGARRPSEGFPISGQSYGDSLFEMD